MPSKTNSHPLTKTELQQELKKFATKEDHKKLEKISRQNSGDIAVIKDKLGRIDQRTIKTDQKIDQLMFTVDGLAKMIKDHIVDETASHKLEHRRINGLVPLT